MDKTKKTNNTPTAQPLTDDELTVMRFLDEHRQPPLPDDGFTRQVMEHIPSRLEQMNRIWTLTCAAAGLAFFILQRGWAGLLRGLSNAAGDLLGALSSVPYSGLSPLVLGMMVLVLFYVGVYHVAAER